MIIYVASPFHGDGTAESQRENMKRAAVYCAWVVQRGHVPYAPHLLFPNFLDENKPEHREIALKAGQAMLNRCDQLWAFTENGISDGMRAEMDYARRIGKQVYMMNPEKRSAK
ncbi:MAG: DUF4406 domain-containing protein [Kiritimatiellia bacterium]